jgi:hypothetical protein
MVAATTALAPLLAEALSVHDPDVGLRSETEADLDFLAALYTSVRWEELAPVDWPDAAKRAFLEQQCRLQHDHYLQHYPDAELLLIAAARSADPDSVDHWPDPAASGRELIGRIYLRTGSTEIRRIEAAASVAG